MSQLTDLRHQLHALGSPEKVTSSQWFFKTGPGQYGEGDEFIGVTVPEQRTVARHFRDLPLPDLQQLLLSPIHEERLEALFILVGQYQRGDAPTQKAIYEFYLAHADRVNNWDLVDSSAEYIVGPWLQDKDRTILTKLAASPSLWERRIAMLATFHYIKQGDAGPALQIAELLLHDQHDLIQKAVGWMLREIGKRCSRAIEEQFLSRHYTEMPRTMLRYAIEHFPEDRRQAYLHGTV
ncbi:MAG TPA: DNA alkylation repair protein [Candidatus Acidoferrum sp.]|nr:DNA alkylation repair protein [Candidatus Acidoferrum sp.]